MPGSGVWLDDETYRQTAAQLWGQQQVQKVQAGANWANQALQATMDQLKAMVPQVPQAVSPPAPAPTPQPAPGPVQPAPVSTPTPPPAQVAPAAPEGQTPVTASAVDTATPQPQPAPAPQPIPETPPVPTPGPASSMVQAGQDWANQQLQNLLGGQGQTPQPTPSPTPTPAPAPTPSPDQGDFQAQARAAAQAAGIDPDIFSRQIQQESGFDPNARSSAGAQGIAQFMPATAQGLGVDPNDPAASLQAAARLDAQNLQRYQGDWRKALAAYNAGPGAVDQYGGVPPFDETQSYVKNILGGAQNVVQQGLSAVNTAVQGVQSAVARVSQFAMGLSSGDAMAFCGPAAAMAFAATYGRNPTVDEAKALAQQVGWNPSQGMAGPQSEVALLNKLGIDAHMTPGVDWSQVASDASSGNPVIIDTPGHYYYVDGFNADSGKFHVGTSGTDLRGGSEWMSADQINGMSQSGGGARAAIFADHPLSQAPGTAAAGGPTYMGTMQPAAAGDTPSSGLDQLLSSGRDLLSQTASLIQRGVDQVGGVVGPAYEGYQDWAAGNRQAAAGVPVLGGVSDLTGAIGDQSTPLGAAMATLPIGGGIEMPGFDIGGGLKAAETTFGPEAGALGAPWSPRSLEVLQQGPQDIGATPLILRQLDQAAQARAEGLFDPQLAVGVFDQMGRRIPPGAIESPFTSMELGQPYYDQYGVLQREPLPPTYGPHGVEQPFGLGGEMVPAEPMDAQPSSDVLVGLQNMVDARRAAPEAVSPAAAEAAPETPSPEPEPEPAPTGALEQFGLTRQPVAGATPLSDEELLNHFENLGQQYEENERQINLLHDQLEEVSRPGVAPERPPWATGISNAQLIQIARDAGESPYRPLWWEHAGLTGAGEQVINGTRFTWGQSGELRDVLREGAGRSSERVGQPTIQGMRQELTQLRAQNQAIQDATDSLMDEGGPVYQMAPPQATELPFDTGGATTTGPEAENAGNQGAYPPPARGSGEAPPGMAAPGGAADDAPETGLGPRLPGQANLGYALGLGGAAAGAVLANRLGITPDDIGQKVQDFAYGGPIGAFSENLRGLGQDLMSPAPDWLQNLATNTPVTAVMHPMSDLYQAISGPGILESMQTLQDMKDKYAGGSPWGIVDPSQMTPQDRDAYNQANLNIMAMTMPAPHGPVSMAERARAYHVANAIGGAATVSKVALNSAINPAWSFVTRGAADLLGTTGLAPGLSSAEAFGRARGSVLGAQTGMASAAQAFMDGLNAVRGNPTSIANRATGIGDVIFGRATETPAAIHSAFQNMGANVLRQMEIGRLYGQEAAARGLTGSAFTSHVAAGIASPSAAIRDAADALANRAVLRGELGTLGGVFGNMVGQGQGAAPGTARTLIGNFLAPVFRVGMNALTQGLEKSPLGLVGTGWDVARAAAGTGPYRAGNFETPLSRATAPLSERLTNNLAGTAVSLWFAKLAADGTITGDGPSDPDQARVLESEGWQANSIRTPFGYVSYKGTPLEVPLQLAGNYADVINGHTPMTQLEQMQPLALTAAERMLGHVTGMLASPTALETLGSIADLVSGLRTGAPDELARGGASTIANLASSWIPASSTLRSVELATDPLQRQAASNDVLGKIAAGIPGLAQGVQPRLDALGQALPNPQQGLGAILPARIGAGAPNPLLAAMARVGVAPSSPPQTVNIDQYRDLRLTPEERTRWDEIRGQVLARGAATLANNPDFQNLPLQSQRAALNGVLDQANTAANHMILSTIGAPAVQARAMLAGQVAPVQGYQAPGLGDDFLTQQTRLRNEAMSQALMNALLSNQSGQEALRAQQLAALGVG